MPDNKKLTPPSGPQDIGDLKNVIAAQKEHEKKMLSGKVVDLRARRILRLKNALDRKFAERNVMEFSEFIRYIPLFQRNLIDENGELSEEIIQLGMEYGERVDPYAQLTIVHGNEEIIKLPAKFCQFAVMNDEGIQSINRSRGVAANTNVPGWIIGAFMDMYNNLSKSQLDDEHIEYVKQLKEQTEQIKRQFDSVKAKANVSDSEFGNNDRGDSLPDDIFDDADFID